MRSNGVDASESNGEVDGENASDAAARAAAAVADNAGVGFVAASPCFFRAGSLAPPPCLDACCWVDVG